MSEIGRELPARHTRFEVIDGPELARRWCVPESWIYDHVRGRCDNPIPHKKLGKYVRFEWGSPELDQWWVQQSGPTDRL